MKFDCLQFQEYREVCLPESQFLVPKNESNNLKPLDLDSDVLNFTKGSVPGVIYIQHLSQGELERLSVSRPNIQSVPEGISCSPRRDSLAKEGDRIAAKKVCGHSRLE